MSRDFVVSSRGYGHSEPLGSTDQGLPLDLLFILHRSGLTLCLRSNLVIASPEGPMSSERNMQTPHLAELSVKIWQMPAANP